MKPLTQIFTILVAILLLLIARGSVGVSAEPSLVPGSQGIQGVWQIVSAEGAGVSESKRHQVEVTDKLLVIRADKRLVIEAKYTLDPNRTPPAIDLHFKGQATLGIYDLTDNTLRLS